MVLAKDMNAAADEIVKVRSRARRGKLDPAEVPKSCKSAKGSGCWRTRTVHDVYHLALEA